MWTTQKPVRRHIVRIVQWEEMDKRQEQATDRRKNTELRKISLVTREIENLNHNIILFW